MKKIFKYIFILGVGTSILSLSSCDGDYLETSPSSSIEVNDLSPVTGANIVNGIAQLMVSQYGNYSQGYCGENRVMTMYGEYLGPNYIYNSFVGWSDVMNGDLYTGDRYQICGYGWNYYYGIISNANRVIANISTETAKGQFVKAQALTFRAYAYQRLVQIYAVNWQHSNEGAADGVVLRLDESTTSMPLSTEADCYAQIYQDCKDAISLFKESGLERNASEVWLPNINAAYAVYARAASCKLDWEIVHDNAILAQVGFDLMDNADYLSGFCEPTSEWILGSYGDESENLWYFSYGTQFACNGYYAQNTNYGAGSINTSITDTIPDSDIRKGMFITKDLFPGFDYSDADVMNQSSGVIQSDSLRGLIETYIHAHTPSGLDYAYENADKGFNTDVYIGAHLKLWVFGQPGISYLPFIRTSEMVLLEAEANHMLNDDAAAQDNMIALNKTTGRDPNYTCTKTGDDLMAEIKTYRALELFGEGFSWFDSKRWNDHIVRTSIADGGSANPVLAVDIDPDDPTKNNFTWVIPYIETNYNDSIN